MNKYSLLIGKSKETVLSLEEGFVLELDRGVEDELELIKDGKPVARARLLVNDGELALLITEVLQA